MNIYEMLAWIRKCDNPNGHAIAIGEFLFNQYTSGRLQSEDLWYMIKDLYIAVLEGLRYE